VRGGVPGKYCDQSLRIPMKSKGMAMKAGAFIQLAMNTNILGSEVRESRGQDLLGGRESHTKVV
jgi:hypothetical protein